MATKKTTPRPPLRKRKRRGGYKTGVYQSTKCVNEMIYRSGWELAVAIDMDQDPNVVSYQNEPFEIYYSMSSNSRLRKYFPDFLVTYADGTKKLLEVKRDDKVKTKQVIAKAKAAESWCAKNGATYEFMTEVDIKHLLKKHVVEMNRVIAENTGSPAPKLATSKKAPAKKTSNPKTVSFGATTTADDGRVVVDIGLDISTSITGYCVLTDKGDLVKLGYFKLTSTKLEDEYDKIQKIKEELKDVLDTTVYRVRHIYAEEAHQQFTKGKSSAKTILTLASFNTVVCHAFREYFGVKPIKVGVKTVRSKLKIKIASYKEDPSKSTKEKVFEIVHERYPEFPWETHVAATGKHKGNTVFGKQNHDMADAYVVCRGAQVLFNEARAKL